MSLDYDRNLFGEIERFVGIKILNKDFQVPDKLELLRVFQFLDFSIDYARLCWNGSCKRCVVKFENGPGPAPSGEALSCRLKACEGMNLTRLPSAIKPAPDR